MLARMGLKVVNNRDGSVHIYQPPGEANALGRIRFNFPNRFLVYQHDTPDKHMFAHDMRAYSHGCMRVQDPAKYAEVLFNIARPSENWTAERIKRMFGTGEQDIQLPDADLGTSDLSDRVRRRRRQAADPPRRLQHRQPHAWRRSRASAAMVEPTQERHERDQEVVDADSAPSRVRRPRPPRVVVVLRVAVRRRPASKATAGAAAPRHSLICIASDGAPDAEPLRRAARRHAATLRILSRLG